MPDDVTVTTRDDGQFDVEVRRGRRVTRHVVRVPPGSSARLGGRPDIDPSELVRVSFEFLLEREPPTSILADFGLDVIDRYFPDYPDEMARRLGGLGGSA